MNERISVDPIMVRLVLRGADEQIAPISYRADRYDEIPALH